MIRINRDLIQTPDIFASTEVSIAVANLEKYYQGTKGSRSQKRFSRPFDPEIRMPILAGLKQLFRGKCAYCESIVDNEKSSTYDHFRPKYGARGLEKEFSEDHYWWLTYEWRNFYYSCPKCNQFKATWFPVEGKRAAVRTGYEKIIREEKAMLIDPCNENPVEHLGFSDDGLAVPHSEKGRVTIDILQLNRKALVSDRSSTLEGIAEAWMAFVQLLADRNKHWPEIKLAGMRFAAILDETSEEPYIALSKRYLTERISGQPVFQRFFGDKEYELTIETKRLTWDIPAEVTIIEKPGDRLHVRSGYDSRLSGAFPVILTKQVYLDSIEVENYKCFDHLKIDLKQWDGEDNKEGNERPWLLLLGENGVGKSSVLKAFAIALMGASNHVKWQEYLQPSSLLKHGRSKGFIKLRYNNGEESVVSFSKTSTALQSTLSQPISNLIAYGSIRLLPKGAVATEAIPTDVVKVGNLFDYTVALQNATQWLLQAKKKDFDKAAITIKDLMLLPAETLLVKDKANNRIVVRFENRPSIPVDELSDGYRTIYALSVDIIATLSSENITYDLAEGIVIIDELETHLHPRWKMQVVERLRAAFPRLNFIVSTHEPLCLRGLHKDEAVVLMPDAAGEIMALTDLPDPGDLRIDQILTSEFFGLRSTMDAKTERLFDEYYAILAKDEGERTPEEVQRSFELNALIPRIKHLGDDVREDLVYYVVDQLLAQQVKDKGLKIADLKAEALSRVRSAWNTILTETNNDLPR